MKFRSDNDAKLFLVEINKLGLINEATRDLKPTTEMIGLLKKQRSGLQRGLKSFRRSQASKSTWRKYGAEIMRGIKAFHRSTEGKRFHKNLSRFLVRKDLTGFISGKPLGNKVAEELDFWEKAEAIKAISSAKTHLFIEMEYYHPIYEQMGLEELVLGHVAELNEIEQAILHDSKLTDQNYSLLFLLTEASAIIKSLADKSGKSVEDVEAMWKKIKQSLIDQGRSEDEENFFAVLTGSLKKALKIK